MFIAVCFLFLIDDQRTKLFTIQGNVSESNLLVILAFTIATDLAVNS